MSDETMERAPWLTNSTKKEVHPEHTMVDGLIEVDEHMFGVRSERFIHVRKFRRSNVLRGRHAFRITNDRITVFECIESLYADERAVAGDCPLGGLSTGIAALDAMAVGGWRLTTLFDNAAAWAVRRRQDHDSDAFRLTSNGKRTSRVVRFLREVKAPREQGRVTRFRFFARLHDLAARHRAFARRRGAQPLRCRLSQRREATDRRRDRPRATLGVVSGAHHGAAAA